MNTICFQHFAQSEPDAAAVVDPRGAVFSRGHLYGASNQLARALRARGLRPGDSIGIIAPNCIEHLQAYFAATQIGLYVISLNWHLAPAELAYILTDAKVSALLVHERMGVAAGAALALCDPGPRVLLSIGPLPGFAELQAVCAACPPDALSDAVPGRVLIYTSATTGRPKGIELPLSDAAEALARAIGMLIGCDIHPGSGNVHLCASMLYHAAPLDMATLALHMGHLVVLVDRWDAESLLRLIDTHGVTTTFMVPAMFVRMLKLPAEVRRRYSCRSLRFVAHSSAPCPAEIKRQMIDWWGPLIWESYGSSEGSGTIVDSHAWLRYPGTVGRPIPGSTIKILDPAGKEVPAGVPGAIYLSRYTGDRFAYRGDAQKTRLAYREELFTVGDVGYLNEEGYLFMCDRAIDMIISGGMNIYPAEIERALIQHPAVEDCAVYGVPDELLGEAVSAAVQVRDGVAAGASLTLELLDFLGERISAGKLPRRIDYRTALPRDPNGKIFKRLLREPDRATHHGSL